MNRRTKEACQLFSCFAVTVGVYLFQSTRQTATPLPVYQPSNIIDARYDGYVIDQRALYTGMLECRRSYQFASPNIDPYQMWLNDSQQAIPLLPQDTAAYQKLRDYCGLPAPIQVSGIVNSNKTTLEKTTFYSSPFDDLNSTPIRHK